MKLKSYIVLIYAVTLLASCKEKIEVKTEFGIDDIKQVLERERLLDKSKFITNISLKKSNLIVVSISNKESFKKKNILAENLIFKDKSLKRVEKAKFIYEHGMVNNIVMIHRNHGWEVMVTLENYISILNIIDLTKI